MKTPITARERELVAAIGRAQGQLEQVTERKVNARHGVARAWRILEDALVAFSADVGSCAICGDWLDDAGRCPGDVGSPTNGAR